MIVQYYEVVDCGGNSIIVAGRTLTLIRRRQLAICKFLQDYILYVSKDLELYGYSILRSGYMSRSLVAR